MIPEFRSDGTIDFFPQKKHALLGCPWYIGGNTWERCCYSSAAGAQKGNFTKHILLEILSLTALWLF